MTIEVNLKTGYFENYKDLVPFQGNLKNYEDERGRERLMNSILTEGIIHPTFVWVDRDVKYIWDGHGRQEIYQALAADGYEIPDLPVVYIIAKNKADAKIKLLKKEQDFKRRVSQDGLMDFLKDEKIISIDIEGMDLPGVGELDISFLDEIFTDENNPSSNNKKDNSETPGDVRAPEKKEDLSNKNKEINTETFGDELKHICPRCNFNF